MKVARTGRLLPLLVLPLASLTLAAPATAATTAKAAVVIPVHPASGGASAIAGYLWSTSDSGSISVNTYYSYNSTGSAVSLVQTGTGTYMATFSGLGSVASSAIVQVTPYSSGDTCSVDGWNAVNGGADLAAYVDCFAIVGEAPDNTNFDLVVTRPVSPPHGTFDYALVNKASGILTASQYNSAGKNNYVSRPSTGHYVVTLGGPASTGTHGTVKVSSWGDLGGDCELIGWHGTSAGQVVNVDCRSGGVFVNRSFMVTFTTASNLMGLNGATTANALATGTAAVYQPPAQYDSVNGAQVTILHLNTGQYEVVLAGSRGNGDGGDIQVSSYGSAYRHCISDGWSAGQLTPTAYVTCFDDHAHEADSSFVVNWVVA